MQMKDRLIHRMIVLNKLGKSSLCEYRREP